MSRYEKLADEIIKKAQDFGYTCFVFGDEVYSFDEARDSIIEHAKEEIKRFRTVEAYRSSILSCAAK